MNPETDNTKIHWWQCLPLLYLVDGKPLKYSWIRFSDLVIVIVMCATTYGIVFVLCKFGYMPRRWIEGDIRLIVMGWSLVFLGLAAGAFFFWQPDHFFGNSWRTNAGIALFCVVLSGVSYLTFGRGNDGYIQGRLIYVPLVVAYFALWSIPRALWRSSRNRSLSPDNSDQQSKLIQRF